MRNMLYIAFQYKTDEACKPWMFSLVMLPSNVFLKLILHVDRIHYFLVFLIIWIIQAVA